MRTAVVPVALFVPSPTLTSVTPTGGVAGSYTYKVVGVAVDGTTTAASAGVTDAAGPTTLDGTHFETLAWTDPANAVSVRIYRTAGGATQGLIGTVAAGVQTFVDTGAAGDANTAPSTNTTGVGGPADVAELRDLTFQLSGTFVATVQLQGRIDGAAGYQNIGSALTTSGFVDVSATAKTLSELRLQMTAFTSGAPVAVVAGH